MKLSTQEMGDFFILDIEGEVDAEHAPQLKKAVTRIKEGAFKGIALDFAKVGFIDSTGLGILISLMRDLKEQGRHLRLVGLVGEVRSIFEITRLYKVFDLSDTLDKALQDMRAKF